MAISIGNSRRRRNSLVLAGVGLLGGILALWENEGRFDYSQAAHDARLITAPADAAPGEAIAFESALDTRIPIEDARGGIGRLTARRWAAPSARVRLLRR